MSDVTSSLKTSLLRSVLESQEGPLLPPRRHQGPPSCVTVTASTQALPGSGPLYTDATLAWSGGLLGDHTPPALVK